MVTISNNLQYPTPESQNLSKTDTIPTKKCADNFAQMLQITFFYNTQNLSHNERYLTNLKNMLKTFHRFYR